jgi:hypothetical protein
MSVKKETKQLSKMSRIAESEIIRAEAGTDPHLIKLVWSTGFKGLRNAWDGKFYEELDMSASAVDMSRLNKSAPVLAQHDATVSSTIGVVERAWLDNGLGYADVRLSKRAEVQGVVQDVIDGILRNVSVGYTVQEFTDVTKRGDAIKTLKATRWLPQEISIVSIGFDPNAQTLRAEDTAINEVTILSTEEQMPETQEKREAAPAVEAPVVVKEETAPVVETPKVDLEEIRRQAVAEYQTRSEEIRSAVKAAGLEESYAATLIARNIPTAEASKEIFKTLEAKNAPKSNENGDSQKVTMTKRELAEAALLNRLDARKFKVDSANPYKRQTLLTIAEAVVERNPGESDAVFAKRAISSSTLAELLSNTANKILSQDGPENYSYTKIAEQVQLSDFKSTPIVKLSMSGLSAKSAETDDYTDTAMVDTGENMQLVDRGALFKISYTALMNDDLGAFSKLPQKAAMLGARDIEAQLYALLNANPTMSDTKALFHADHANIVTGGVGPTVAGVDAAQQLMAAFADDSSNPMDLQIKYIVVPPSLALTAKQTARAIMASSAGNVNPFAGDIEVIVSSRIAQVGGKDCWFAITDPSVWSSLVVGTLQGQGDQPEVMAEEDFNSKNLKIRVSQPSDVAAASYKGIVRTVLA